MQDRLPLAFVETSISRAFNQNIEEIRNKQLENGDDAQAAERDMELCT